MKILSQAGQSLADMYQVEGSIAGIDQLDTRELPIVHEVGATVFSERFRTTIRRVESGNVAQSQNIDLEINDLPASISRILGLLVLSDDGSRINHLCGSVNAPVVATTPPLVGQDFPFWVYSGDRRSVRVEDDGTVAVFESLLGEAGALMLPTFCGGRDQGGTPVQNFRLRGGTTAFGAGTVFVTALLYLAFTEAGGVSAFGAHVPSW